MLPIISLILTLGIAYFAYSAARRFVRDRLRFVEGARKFRLAILAAAGVFVITIPFAWLLPFVGAGTALALAAGVGVGVAAGSRDLNREDAGAMIVRSY